MRINAQLVDAVTDFPMWAERFDRELKDVFDVAGGNCAEHCTGAPYHPLSTARKHHGAKANRELAGDDYLLRGRNYIRRENLEFAMQMFEHATALIRNFRSPMRRGASVRLAV